MTNERIMLWADGEYNYSNGKYQLQYIDTYIHDDDELRPSILVIPGGGYRIVAGNESDNVAQCFYEMGYQTFVLCYTVDEPQVNPLKLQPLNDLSRALRYIRMHSKEFKIYQDQVALCGFSAGGHLAASLCVHYEDIKDIDEKFNAFSNRPSAAILCYPVITTGFYTHEDSIKTLLGPMATMDEIKYMSLEKHVTKDTPPCFIWTTALDDIVPIENSELFAKALRGSSVPYALHIFSEGRHGRDLGEATETEPEITEITIWPDLADEFLMRYM